MDDLQTCPFCSAALEPFGPDQANHPRNDCWLASVGVKRAEYGQWNQRATAGNAAPTERAIKNPADAESAEGGAVLRSSVTDVGSRGNAAPTDACAGCDPAEGFCKVCRDAEKLATSAAAPGDLPGWISVDERLPEDTAFVAIFDPENEGMPVRTAQWLGGSCTFESEMGWLAKDEVTHWMPLPAAPSDTSPVGATQDKQEKE
jgi:hypothetical protein